MFLVCITADMYTERETQQILVRHKPMVAKYIDTNFDLFFEKYNTTLIKSESYVTKRQSIKLLGEVLLDRQFYDIMTRYVESGDNLKLVMWQLKDDRKMVQYEAFHVFKVCMNPAVHVYPHSQR